MSLDKCDYCNAEAVGTRAGGAIGVCDKWPGCYSEETPVFRILRLLLELPDAEARLAVIEAVGREFCLYCGCEQPTGRNCQCWNDE